MTKEPDWKELAKRLNKVFEKPGDNPEVEALHTALGDEPAANIALAMEGLTPEQAVRVFATLDMPVATEVLAKLEPDLVRKVLVQLQPGQLAGMVKPLPPREAAAIVAEAPRRHVQTYLSDGLGDPSVVHDVEYRLNYSKGTAGRLMTTQFVRLYAGTTIGDALAVVRHTDPKVDIPDDLYIVDRDKTSKPPKNRLLGVVSIRDLLMSDSSQRIEEVMATDVISIAAGADEEDAAALISKYKFLTLPVTDKDGYLIGVIPTDDLMQLVVARLRGLYAKAVGTDTEVMEHLSPFQAAKKRVPWLLGTMIIELIAGLVISHFDGVLKKVILLASFMPVISAVSGNVGLQAAAITVRALDTKQAARKSVWKSLAKELATALFMAAICGLVLGTIGGVWSKHLPFGIVIGGALTCSMLTAGFMGTVIPMASKRLGFDPATTAGPFETAFQDVVGFTVFLWLASSFMQWIT